MYKIYIITLFLLCVVIAETNAANNYGSFDLSITDVKNCKGPKRKDCAITKYTPLGKAGISTNMTVKENIPSMKGKVVGILENKEVMRMNIDKPCSNIFYMPLFKLIVNITDKCVILKGFYHFILDMDSIMQKYHGAAFVFGNWTYKSVFHNDDCNISCGVFGVSIGPKKKP